MKIWIRRIVAVVLVIAMLFGLQQLVVPKYMDDVLEGSFIEEYYDETTDHDVLMVGDCEVYENFSPVTMWEEYGITSYIRGSAQQLIWQSYYLLEEMLQKESPKVVVFNVLSMKYNTPQQEGYNRMTLDGMKWSKSKYDAIRASMMDEENMLDYVFPLLRFHSRITKLESSDFTYYLSKRKVTHNGYYMRIDTLPAEGMEWTEDEISDYTFGENAWDYLDKMRTLCDEHGAKLLLIKAPSISPVWYDEWESQITEYADQYNLTYINYLKLVDELGIDYNTDTYDGGLHMNLSGAEKLSKHLGKVLSEDFGVANHQGEEPYASVWKDKVAFYHDMISAQQKELDTYGFLKSFGGYSDDADDEDSDADDADGDDPDGEEADDEDSDADDADGDDPDDEDSGAEDTDESADAES